MVIKMARQTRIKMAATGLAYDKPKDVNLSQINIGVIIG